VLPSPCGSIPDGLQLSCDGLFAGIALVATSVALWPDIGAAGGVTPHYL